MKRFVMILAALGSATAYGASCGTVASPTGCTLTVGGQVQYSFSNFQLVNSVSSIGQPYEGGDILIDLSPESGLRSVLTLSRNQSGPTPGSSFSVNSGETRGFGVSFDMGIAAVAPGTAVFDPQLTHAITRSTAGNGAASVQFIVPGIGPCVATAGTPSVNCTMPGSALGGGVAGMILNLSGNSGNAAILNMRQTFGADFTPATESGVPEPSTWALLGGGLAAIGMIRRRR